MSRSLLFLPLLLTACPPAEDKVGETDDAPDVCDIIIEESLPTVDQIDAYYRGNIEFRLSDPDPTATIVTNIPGSQLPSVDNETFIWEISAPLSPSTAYTATLDYCRGSAVINFGTSALGTAVEDSTLLGRTYTLDLANARIVEPAGIGSVLTSYLTQDILVGVDSIADGEVQMIGAIGAEDAEPPRQDFCDPTIPFPAADWSASPYFQIGPQTTTLSVAGYDIEIGDLEITGTFASDGSYFGGGTLAGTIDTRPLAPLLDDSGDEGAICDLAINFGATCTACSDDKPFCLTLVADQIIALEVANTTLIEVGGNNCMGCESATAETDLSATCEVTPE